MPSSAQTQQTVLVTGANGYIGAAVARAFQRAGYQTLGLIRSSSASATLERQSIIPIVGSAKDSEAVLSSVKRHTSTLNVLVSTTEDTSNYLSHFNDTLVLLRTLARSSDENGVRPLVLFTSGCKDYGRGELDGSPKLEAHTEESPLNGPEFLAARTKYAPKILEEKSFDAVLLRPTHVHGYSSSYFGLFFEMAAEAKREHKSLTFRADPQTIQHSLHVDDCGEAYVALADPSKRHEVAGQSFNISPGKRYETLRQIGEGLAKVYGLPQGVNFENADPTSLEPRDLVSGFSQWVGSEKIRELTGWKEQRPLFAEGIERYKTEHEKAVREQDANVAKVSGRDWNKSAKSQAKDVSSGET